MDKDNILKNLKMIESSISAVIAQMEAEKGEVETTIADVRKFAILEEVFRENGKVKADKLSELAIKYGKTPGSSGGYFSGDLPSMTSKADDARIPESLLKPNWFNGEWRYLTEEGLRVVIAKRAEWGEDWLDRIPLEIVGSKADKETIISF